jgi:hypothetical protein
MSFRIGRFRFGKWKLEDRRWQAKFRVGFSRMPDLTQRAQRKSTEVTEKSTAPFGFAQGKQE